MSKPLVAIIMGSDSDWPTMKNAAQMLADFSVPYEAKVVSAHRTPELMVAFAQNAANFFGWFPFDGVPDKPHTSFKVRL